MSKKNIYGGTAVENGIVKNNISVGRETESCGEAACLAKSVLFLSVLSSYL